MSFIETVVKGWNKYVEPLYNWIPANIQALWWLRQRKKGKSRLKLLKEMAPNTQNLLKYFESNEWGWQSDPLGGALDFTSKLWVICVKKGGDCDDFAALWHHLMKPHGRVEMLITGKKWSFHKMVIYTSTGVCYLFSNLKLFRVVPEERKHALYDAFYKDKTWFTVVY